MSRYAFSLVAATLLGLLLSVSTFALAQTAPASEQALGNKLMTELQASLQCSTQLITAQQEITRLRAELEAAKKPAEKK